MQQVTRYWGLQQWSVVLATGLLIALASTGLAACGYNGSPQSSTPSTQPQTQGTRSSGQVTRPQIQGTRPPTQMTPSRAQQCGAVQGYGRLEVVPIDNGAEQAENCFWLAFQHCQPATLIFITNNLATKLIRTFEIHDNHGTCSISDARQQRIASTPPAPATIYTCAGLIRHPRALDFTACGQDGTVVVLGS